MLAAGWCNVRRISREVDAVTPANESETGDETRLDRDDLVHLSPEEVPSEGRSRVPL
jgi:hypothetical protein